MNFPTRDELKTLQDARLQEEAELMKAAFEEELLPELAEKMRRFPFNDMWTGYLFVQDKMLHNKAREAFYLARLDDRIAALNHKIQHIELKVRGINTNSIEISVEFR